MSLRPAHADNDDLVTLLNTNVIAGEVKELQRGKLQFKTDSAGTLQIEWDDVVALVTERPFEVEVGSGETYFGRLDSPEPSTLRVTGAEEAWLLRIDEVVLITPIGATFIAQVEGSFDLGFTLASANNTRTLNTAFQSSHRTRKYLRKFDFSTILTDQDDADRLQRTVGTFELSRFVGQKWTYVGTGSAESNEELDLELRVSLTGGVRRQLRQTKQSLFSVLTGLAVNQEHYVGSSPSENLEVVGSLAYERFQYEDPEINFTVTLSLLPSLTNSGRVRAQLDSRLQRELISDFFLALSWWATHDSEPPLEDAEKSDYGITTSIGYSF